MFAAPCLRVSHHVSRIGRHQLLGKPRRFHATGACTRHGMTPNEGGSAKLKVGSSYNPPASSACPVRDKVQQSAKD